MSEHTPVTVVVDISKDFLDTNIHPSNEARRFTNDAAGHNAMIVWLRGRSVERVVFEATGAYHRAFERTVAAAGQICGKPSTCRRSWQLGSTQTSKPNIRP